MQPNDQIITNIINQNKHYGKDTNTNKKIKIAILNNNISISQLIYIDTLSRVLSYGNNDITVDYYINEKNLLETKNKLEDIRINFNEYITFEDLDNNIEEILDILKFSRNCSINNNCLYFDNHKLIDENGNYNEYLKKANYYKEISNNYDNIIVIEENLIDYINVLKILNLNNLINLDIPKLDNIAAETNIDKLRIETLNPNLDIKTIENIFLNLNKFLNNNKQTISETEINTYTDTENDIITFLNDFNNMILKVQKSLNLNSLIYYLNNLIIIIEDYLKQLTNTKIYINQINLLKSLKIVLNNSLDLLGIIPVYL